ncbi:MAG: tetratricopeptide repeat protein [Acidobacteria bacterium]|nr:tetratricopeptide repeat protein [Acidobacteriota bacterium]MCI0725012.1 tetratricopeptide repeat protein [Acidobacteriota bacterium]
MHLQASALRLAERRFIAAFSLILCSEIFLSQPALFAEVQSSEQKQPLALLQEDNDNISEAAALKVLEKSPTHLGSTITLGTIANRRGKLDLARGYLLRALELDPKSAEAYHQLALNYGHRRELDKAVQAMEGALWIEPHNPIYRYNLGALCYNSGSYPNALQQFRQALQLQPRNFEFHFALASTLEAEKRLSEAEAEFTKILETYPRQARTYSARAALLMQLGKVEEARQDAEKAILLEPAHAAAHYLLGRIHEQNQDLQGALEAYLRVTELEEGHFNARYRLGLIYARLGQKEEGRRESSIFQSLQLKIDSTNALIFGTNYLRQGDPGNAEQHFATALQSDPQNAEALYYLGLVQQQKGEHLKAIDTFQKALSVNPHLAIVHANLGLTLASLDRAEQARPHLERAVDLDSDDFGVNSSSGRGFLMLEDFPRAEKALLRSLQLWPSQSSVLIDLFQLYVLCGKNEQARRYAELAVDANPLDARLHYRVGLFWAAEQDFDRAKVALQKAVELMSDFAPPYLRLAWVYAELKEAKLAMQTVSRHLELDPRSGEGHFLKGKLQFENGDASGALEELRLAAELSPRDPQVFFLLSQVYRHLGHKQEANEALGRHQALASTSPE